MLSIADESYTICNDAKLYCKNKKAWGKEYILWKLSCTPDLNTNSEFCKGWARLSTADESDKICYVAKNTAKK